jgi:hypothetical protein
MMGALGNSLFLISQAASGIGSIGGVSLALDFSLLAVFIVGIYAGPKSGFVTGLIAGIIPGIVLGTAPFGVILNVVAIPLGKGLTGLTIGLLATNIKIENKLHKALLFIPLILIAYIPEGIFTYTYFMALLPIFLSKTMAAAGVYTILTKAIIEVSIMSLIIAALVNNKSVNNFIEAHFKTKSTKN